MFTALNKLGYNCYHGLVAATDPRSRADRHLACWHEALNYKVYGIGRAYSPLDLDKILQYYSTVTDMPCINFSKELIEQFPNAKVILTHRDPQAWIKSVNNTILHVLSWRIWPVIKYIEPNHLTPFRDCVQLYMEDWTLPAPYNDQEALLKYISQHTALIKSLVPAENLLEFQPGDGWEPLCEFLGKKMPVDEPFPFANKGLSIVDMVRYAIRREMVRFLKPYLVGLGTLAGSWLVGRFVRYWKVGWNKSMKGI
ncbi:hypothetical protein HYALB_00001690 [Hymenoscyphus albidus]|uniref:NAD dependent epimerase/dehydratase n=1 Tax=Hymenoscyphus albidus TaxID=595503 RepID=A0A9N9LIR0_9HELO|nr:hypothetical protein HYALB_00001690 [Hymenoscyphus albidus]